MKNETPMYLVPGNLTDEQASKAGEAAMRALALGRETCIADYIIHAIGTPIQPCADIPVIATLGTLRDPVPCVRQSDALAKLAEKDAEIGRLSAIRSAAKYLLSEEYIGLLERAVVARLATTSNNEDKHCKAAELVIAARAALNEGAAG